LNLPARFRSAAEQFAEELKASFASAIPAQPEDQLKSPVRDLLASAASNVFTRTEAQLYEIGGRPDIGVSVRNALCGHVELKAPGIGARTSRYHGRDKEQWEKFKALPNVLYTDAVEWALYRSGVQQPKNAPVVVRFGDLIQRGAAALDDSELAKLHMLLWQFSVSDFFVVESWIKSRLRDRTGRRSSPLDEIRPAMWTAGMTQELLELLWVVEATIDAQPELNAVLNEILAGPLFTAADLPQPSEEERRPPVVEEVEDEHEEMVLE
jgi:hypothetical protein